MSTIFDYKSLYIQNYFDSKNELHIYINEIEKIEGKKIFSENVCIDISKLECIEADIRYDLIKEKFFSGFINVKKNIPNCKYLGKIFEKYGWDFELKLIENQGHKEYAFFKKK